MVNLSTGKSPTNFPPLSSPSPVSWSLLVIYKLGRLRPIFPESSSDPESPLFKKF